MNKGIPTLLGLAIILLVVILILSVYNLTVVSHLARGERVVGTTAQKVFSGGEMPGREGHGGRAREAPGAGKPVVSATELQEKGARTRKGEERQAKSEERQGSRRSGRQASTTPGER